MVKIRIIPTLLFKEFTLVKGKKFDSWRRVGSILQAIKVYNMREVDELVFLDITATAEGREPDFQLVDDFADDCFMPLAVGGGIRSVADVRRLLQHGADKVVINTAAFLRPELLSEAAKKFGSQSIVVSIDAKKNNNGDYEVFTHSGTKATQVSPTEFAKQAEKMGAGEILLTSIDRDGTMEGYDIELIKSVAGSVSVPVIAAGGAGECAHMYEALTTGKASAIGAASIFHFTETTPLMVKQCLKDKGIHVRV